MRALRLLPAGLPHLRTVAGGNGFAARPDLFDEDGLRRQRDHQRNMGEPFRRLPGLHGLHDGMPFRRRVWKTDRGYPSADPAALHAASRGKEVSQLSVQHLYASGSASRAIAAVASVSENGTPSAGTAHGPPKTASRTAAGHGGAAPAGARA